MQLSVMTFNIRNGLADDGANSWQFRKHLLVRAIRKEMPDIMGLQEVFWQQRRFLWAHLSEYEQFGEHREGGRVEEATLICYRHEHFSLLEGGNVWLSASPEVAGSRSWGNRHTRMATWARLRRRADGAKVLVINCHLDHEAQEARIRGAEQLLDLSWSQARGDPVVLIGDFNAWPDSTPYRLLTVQEGESGGRNRFSDAWRIARHSPVDQRTFHGWEQRGFVGQQARIDWILVRPRLEVERVRCPAYREGPRLPSDHYPVVAVIDLRPDFRRASA